MVYELSFRSRCWFFRVMTTLATIVAFRLATPDQREDTSSILEPWQECGIFLAPTTNGMGWGVFAGRSFGKGEIIEFSPGFIPQPAKAIENTVLDDYVYGYFRVLFLDRGQRPEIQQLQVVSLGMVMYLNHHPNPNVEYTTFSREPAPDVPNTVQAIGFIAKRRIQAGEQLFSHYGQDEESWFANRQIELHDIPMDYVDQISAQDLPGQMSEYCSKLHAGIGRPTWEERILPILPPQGLPFWITKARLAPFYAGPAKAKVSISAGDRIEMSAGMIVSTSIVKDSALGAWAISWDDLDATNQGSLRNLRDAGRLIVQYQGADTSWKRMDRFTSLEDVAIFPAAGNGGTIRRVGKDDGNCKLVIHSTMLEDTLGITMEWIATKDIKVGEEVTVNLNQTGSKRARRLLEQELQLTGQDHYSTPLKVSTKYGEL